MENTSKFQTNFHSGDKNNFHVTEQNDIPFTDNTSVTKTYAKKALTDLNMIDAFLFEATTEDSENAKLIAKIIIERATGQTVDELIVETQKQLKGISIDKRGIRMDVYVTEHDKKPNGKSTLRIYDIEPNKYYEKDIPHRSRFYQSLMDSKLLTTTSPFNNLPEVITIWILPYDPFGDNRMLYTVKNMVVENENLLYNDGITKIFLYTKGKKGGSQKLKDLLTYLENSTAANAVDEDLLAIQEIVGTIKCRKEVGERYMTLQEMIDYEKRDSYNDGLERGISLGIQGLVNTYKNLHLDKSQAQLAILTQFSLTDAQAEEYLNLYW